MLWEFLKKPQFYDFYIICNADKVIGNYCGLIFFLKKRTLQLCIYYYSICVFLLIQRNHIHALFVTAFGFFSWTLLICNWDSLNFFCSWWKKVISFMNADYKYLSKISVKIEPRIRKYNFICRYIFNLHKQNYKHLRVYSHFCNYYRLVPKSTFIHIISM